MSSIKIDRAFLRAFIAKAEPTLTEIACEHGIKITYKSGNFARDGSNATIKFEMVAPDASGEIVSREAQDFKRLCGDYGFKPEDLGSTFTSRGKLFRITGLNPRRPKYPISAVRVSDGRPTKFQAESVVRSGHPRRFSEGLTPVIKDGFIRLAGELSPENLSCDGECSDTEVRKRRSNLMRQWGELERRAGRTVSETEAWSFDRA